MERLIECPVCANLYDANKDELIPRMLRECGHTICGACLVRIKKPCGASKNNGHHIRCPTCNTTTKISRKEKTSPKNYLAMAIIDQYRKRCRREEINNNLVAESDQEPPKCPEHPYNRADMLCTTVDCEAPSPHVCYTCLRHGNHINHQTVLFENVFQEHLVRIEAAQKSLSERRKSVLANIDSIEKCQTRDSIRLRAEELSIEKHFERLSAELDEKRLASIKSIQQFFRKRDDGLRNLLAKQKSLCETIEQKEKAIEEVVNFGRADYVRNAIRTKELLETTIEEKPDNLFLPVVPLYMNLPSLTPFRLDKNPVKPVYRLDIFNIGNVANNNIFSHYLAKLPRGPVSGMLVYKNKALLQKMNPNDKLDYGHRIIIYARVDEDNIQYVLTFATQSTAEKIVIGCEPTEAVEEVIRTSRCSDPRVFFEVVREPETAAEQMIDRIID